VFHTGLLDLVILAAIALILIGPDRLPGIARQAGRILRTLRQLAADTRAEISDGLDPDLADALNELRPEPNTPPETDDASAPIS
jgi:sec-independent protein translocase protein TatB